MKKSIQQINLKKILILTVFFAATSVTLYLMSNAATATLEEKISLNKESLSRVQGALGTLPSLEKLEAGQPNSDARAVINETREKATEINNAYNDIEDFSTSDVIRAMLSANHSYRDIRDNRKALREHRQNTQEEIVAYANTLSMLINFIEYNPDIDTMDLSLGSADTSERMDRLRRGLERAENHLEQEENNLPVNRSILEAIRSAREAQAALEQGESRNDFVNTFEALQLEVIEELAEYNENLQPRIREEVTDIIRKL